MAIPLGLRHALEAGECVLFIGAGIGGHLKTPTGDPAPDGPTLAKELADSFSIPTSGEPKLPRISRIVELRVGRPELIAFLKKRLTDLTPDSYLTWLCTLRWKAIFTTNYDRGIQRAYELTTNPPQNFKTITATSDIVPFDERFDVPIYHLHGALFESPDPQIIITQNDYSKYQERRKMLFALLKKEFITSTILYIGYSNQDPNWESVVTEIASEFFPASMPQSYRIDPYTDQLDCEILEAQNIHTLPVPYQEFVAEASATISKPLSDREMFANLQSKVPSDLHKAFEKNTASVTRLLSSWTYVNQASFSASPNLNLFLRGDRPNWALIGSGKYFERDVEESLYDDLLDYATSSAQTAAVRVLLGSAGYGVTTVLMTLAVKLIKERAGAVFMLKPGCQLLEGDVEFAAKLFENRPFFFVDNASDHIENLRTVIQRFRESKIAGMFVLGERLNEWRQSRRALMGKEFLIEALSDPEIDRVLDFLGDNSALNKLEHLSRDMQFAAIKRNYSKELLVSMRAATEGKDFDAILEDEFRGIRGDIPRLAYLVVCCFHQHGTYIRDSLLAELLGIDLGDLYDAISRATEGVIFYDTLDEGRGIYGARARHRIIASVVWERCGSTGDKTHIIDRALKSLNLNYAVDAKAFESFYRSDRVVDSIGSFEAKVQFFEAACKKDPESPYVRQHYARMLMREDKLDVALSQVNAAIELDNKVRVLYHTKGLILAKMALLTESMEIARKRLIQSEAFLRKGLSMAPKDDFCYQGLAQLYLGWARRCGSVSEATEYIGKAEDIISEGLRAVRVRESLWIESAKIQGFLGDNPGYIRYLERAISEAPGGIVSRYLLGRAYRKSGRYPEAAEVLKSVVKDYPDNVRSAVEYALVLHNLGNSPKECIAVLQQSTLYGYSDPRFVATLGGLLFIDNSFTEADKVFEEATKRNFTASELNTIQFRPLNPADRNRSFRMRGTVVQVKAGYALIESEGLPRALLCLGSKFKGILMRKDLKLIFDLVFTAKGPLVDDPKIEVP